MKQFIVRVVSGADAESIEVFYTLDATMQENQSPSHVGRDVLVAHEKAALARAASVVSACVAPVTCSRVVLLPKIALFRPEIDR